MNYIRLVECAIFEYETSYKNLLKTQGANIFCLKSWCQYYFLMRDSDFRDLLISDSREFVEMSICFRIASILHFEQYIPYHI